MSVRASAAGQFASHRDDHNLRSLATRCQAAALSSWDGYEKGFGQ
jgi:hypothetical protein